MVDFYEELNLDREATVEEINKELSNLESTWKRREITNPEKATKKLVLIMDARKAFKDEQSRAEYNAALAESKKEPVPVDTDAERREKLNKWLDDAFNYMNSNQYILAKEAMNNAAKFIGNDENGYFYFFLSVVSCANNDLQTAFNAINKALVIGPEVPNYHMQSGTVYTRMYEIRFDKPAYLNEALDYLEKGRAELRTAISLAEKNGNTEALMNATALLAESYSYCHNQNLDEVERLAKRAISLGDKSGDMEKLIEYANQQRVSFQPYQGKNHPSTTSSGKCYIATAVYGSYDCPQVWVLRRFRDSTLLRTWHGRIFVKIYYTISPKLIRLFGSHAWFNTFWRSHLDKMVERLRNKGVADSKYDDI